MDIEEGEIIISDVSSNDSNDQPWNKDQFRIESEHFSSVHASRSSEVYISSPFGSKNQHKCNSNSFCRKTFTWNNCLSNDLDGKRNRSRTRNEKISVGSLSRAQNHERNHSRQKYNEHIENSHTHKNQRPKKRKRKRKSEISHLDKKKTGKTLRQLMNHCENRSMVINEVSMQLSRTSPSATITTNENNSLMQKLISSGLAKLPVTSESTSDVGIVLPHSQPETEVKKENILVIDVVNRDESDDSEIEVIIPPKKIPPLVTLDSDGEEMELTVKNITCNVQSPQTLSNFGTTFSGVSSMSTPELKTSSENVSHNSKNDLNKAFEVINDSSDSLSSELCDELRYSPSSPSSCHSGDPVLAKEPCSQSRVSSQNSNSQNIQFENNFKNFSSVSNEEIHSEIWLDSNEQLSSDSHQEISTNPAVHPTASVDEEQATLVNTSNMKCGFEKGNSLSDLFDNFTMSSTYLNKDIKNKKQQVSKHGILQHKEDIYENKSENGSKNKHQNIGYYKSVSSLPSNKIGNVSNGQNISTETVISQYCQSKKIPENEFQTNQKQHNNHASVPSDTNIYHPLSAPEVLRENQELHSSYDCNKSKEVDYVSTIPLNLNSPDFISPRQPLIIETSASSLKTKSNILDIKNTNDYATASFIKNPELKTNFVPKGDKTNQNESSEKNNLISNKKCENHDVINKNTEKNDDDDDENVSQLRMIALLTKGKVNCKETKPAEDTEKNNPSLGPIPNDDNIKDQSISEPKKRLDEEDDVLQLRVAALKSAVMKKYGERKKKGLFVKKLKRAPSGFFDNIITSPESNLAAEQESLYPLSPSKSSTSLQGEEDMELADSDNEDVIQEIDTRTIEEDSKLSDVFWDSCSVVDPSARTYEISSTTHALSRNTSVIVPPQPLPPGVDGDCPELTGKTIFTSVLPPPPPPPPPPPLPTPFVFAPMFPPPPPPPLLSPSLESCPQFNQPTLSSNSTNLKSDLNFRDKIYHHNKSTSTSDCTLSKPFTDKDLKDNSSNDIDLSCTNPIVVSEKSKKLDTGKCHIRSNLITIPVVKNILKPVLTKTQLRKRRRKRSKPVIVRTSPQSSLLCITKLPEKSSNKIGGNINLAIVNQTNENNPQMYSDCEGITPVLCDTTPHGSESLKNSDEFDEYGENNWQKQLTKLNCEMNSVVCNLSEEKSVVEEEIDLSEMIVLDEVGMSPEHKSTTNESNWDYHSPQEEEDDEDALRIRALTTLPLKTVIKKPISSEFRGGLQAHIKPVTYRQNWQNYEPSKSENNHQREMMRPKVKPREVHSQRKVVGPDASKYRLTRTTSNEHRRSVVHGRESLKVVVPTSSPALSLLSEPPIVKRLVINVERDSDSEEECEWTRNIRIKDTNTSVPLEPVVDQELERSIDELLMRARNNVKSSSLKQNQGGNARSTTPKPDNKKISDTDLRLQDTPLKLLPKEKQEEYKRLKALLDEKLKERRKIKKTTSSKAPDKTKPLLKHVLINETNKHNQKDNNSHKDSNSSDDSKKPNQCISSRSGQKKTSDEVSTVEGPGKNNKQINFSPDSNEKENCTKIVMSNETNKQNVSSAQNSPGSSNELSSDTNLQPKVQMLLDQCIRMVRKHTNKNSGKNSKNKVQESKKSEFVCGNSKQFSSKSTIKQANENSDNNLPLQRTIMLERELLQETLERNTDSSRENQSETQDIEISNRNSQRRLVICPSNIMDINVSSSTLERPQILPVETDCSSLEKAEKRHLDFNDEGRENKEIKLSTKNTTMNAVRCISTEREGEKSEAIAIGTDEIGCQINEVNSNKPSENAMTHMEVSSTPDCSELGNLDERLCRISNASSDSAKDSNAECVEQRTNTFDVLNNSYSTHQESPQNICLPEVEVLATKKSELLNERFGLLDDLSEMAESLDDLDSQQGRLEQAAMEISALRRTLRAAEDSLREQIILAQSLECRLHDTHTAVTTRYKNISNLERTLHHASYDIPTTAQKMMSKKIKQVGEKIVKVKGKRSIIKYLIKKPDTSKEELTEMNVMLNMKKTDNSEPADAEVENNFWLQDPSTSHLEHLPMINTATTSVSKTDSESQTFSLSTTNETLDILKPCRDNEQRRVQAFNETNNSLREENTGELKTCDSTESSIETGQSSPQCCTLVVSSLANKDISSTISQKIENNHTITSVFKKAEDSQELFAPKRSIAHVSDISEGTLAKKPNLLENKSQSCEIEKTVNDSTRNTGLPKTLSQETSEKHVNVSNKQGTLKTSKSRFGYKSILQYKGVNSRVDSSSSGQTILCPYDLTGRCQDNQCKFQHFH